jgi:hypothetical protein
MSRWVDDEYIKEKMSNPNELLEKLALIRLCNQVKKAAKKQARERDEKREEKPIAQNHGKIHWMLYDEFH